MYTNILGQNGSLTYSKENSSFVQELITILKAHGINSHFWFDCLVKKKLRKIQNSKNMTI